MAKVHFNLPSQKRSSMLDVASASHPTYSIWLCKIVRVVLHVVTFIVSETCRVDLDLYVGG